MSKEENKTVEEINEDEHVIEPEVIDVFKEVDIDDIKEIVPELKAPLRGISTPSMIHEHIDNFLAKIAGETPIDTNPRNSAEFWLDKIADKFANGDGIGDVIRIKKIWENPNPTQGFGAQTVSIDLSEYDMVVISCRFSSTAVSALQPPAFIPVGQAGSCVGVGSAEYCYRVFSVSDSGITVQLASKVSHGGSTPADTPNNLVPTYIYGVKLI